MIEPEVVAKWLEWLPCCSVILLFLFGTRLVCKLAYEDGQRDGYQDGYVEGLNDGRKIMRHDDPPHTR